jgi:hypothetical protein
LGIATDCGAGEGAGKAQSRLFPHNTLTPAKKKGGRQNRNSVNFKVIIFDNLNQSYSNFSTDIRMPCIWLVKIQSAGPTPRVFDAEGWGGLDSLHFADPRCSPGCGSGYCTLRGPVLNGSSFVCVIAG